MKFKIEVTRVDEYEIEVDEKVWDEKALSEWSNYFWDVDSALELAESLAKSVAREGAGTGFIEGFGVVETFYSDGTPKSQYDSKLKKVTDFSAGLSVKIISEDDDIRTDTELIN